MVGGEQGKFLTSVQSSVTATQGNETWWSMQAWLRGSGYEVHGTMVKDVNSTIGEERNQLCGIWEVGNSSKKSVRENRKLEPVDSDPCATGKKHLLIWRHKKDTTTFTGLVGAQQTEIVVTGIVVLTLGSPDSKDGDGDDDDRDDDKSKRNHLVRRQETQEMNYTLTFSGKHHPESAPLPMQGLVWKEPGSGGPMEQFHFFSVGLPTESPSPSPSPSLSVSTVSTVTVSTTVTVTVSTGPGGETEKPDWKSPLPNGAITGIVVGGVLAIVVFMALLFMVKQWRVQKREPKVYPELAYIYSTPFTSVNTRTQSTEGGAGGAGGARASSVMTGALRGASAHHGDGEAGTYYGPTAPQLEVDLGDQTPFIPTATESSTAIGSPGRSRGGGSAIGTSSLAEEREELERELRQPMLSSAGTYREESPARRQYGAF